MSQELDNLRLTLEQARKALHQAHMRIEQLEAHILPKDTPLSPTTSPHLYGQVLDTLLEGCQVIDFDWRYLYVNDMAAQFGRRPKSDYIGHKIQALYPGIEATELFAVLNQCLIERRAHPPSEERAESQADGDRQQGDDREFAEQDRRDLLPREADHAQRCEFAAPLREGDACAVVDHSGGDDASEDEINSLHHAQVLGDRIVEAVD